MEVSMCVYMTLTVFMNALRSFSLFSCNDLYGS